MGTIVVGVDGSEMSVRALRFAVEEARIRGDRVRAVSAWYVPAVAYEGVYTVAGDDEGAFEAAAESRLRDSIERVEAGDVEIESVARKGHPVAVLVDESEQAVLLVVGSRGLGGFRGLLLGSVSQQCAQHARCPTVIVPPTAGPGAEPAHGNEGKEEAPFARDYERPVLRHEP